MTVLNHGGLYLPSSHLSLPERIVGVTVHATALCRAVAAAASVAVMHLIGRAQDLSPTILP